jgi:hypothetical protein
MSFKLKIYISTLIFTRDTQIQNTLKFDVLSWDILSKKGIDNPI